MRPALTPFASMPFAGRFTGSGGVTPNPAPTHLPEAGRLYKDVVTLSGMQRGSFDIDGLKNTAAYIESAFKNLGYAVEEQPVTYKGKPGYKNILAEYGPAGADAIVIGAHYDTVNGFPGADDNASGVAGLLELARLLQENKPKLNKRIILAAYPLEEVALNGSRAHARMIQKQGVKVRGMMSLEMIGYYTDAKDSQTYLHPAMKKFYPNPGNFIAVVGDVFSRGWIKSIRDGIRNNSEMPAYSLAAPPFITTVFRSDHASYRLHGLVPACMVTDTANLRNPNYHRRTDTPDTLGYNRMAELIKGLYGFLSTQ